MRRRAPSKSPISNAATCAPHHHTVLFQHTSHGQTHRLRVSIKCLRPPALCLQQRKALARARPRPRVQVPQTPLIAAVSVQLRTTSTHSNPRATHAARCFSCTHSAVAEAQRSKSCTPAHTPGGAAHPPHSRTRFASSGWRRRRASRPAIQRNRADSGNNESCTKPPPVMCVPRTHSPHACLRIEQPLCVGSVDSRRGTRNKSGQQNKCSAPTLLQNAAATLQRTKPPLTRE